jgi:DNA-binding response OmpR family regulator
MKLLIIDNDRDVVSFLKERFQEKCIMVDQAYGATEGLRMAKTCTYDLIILSHPLGTKSGAHLSTELRRQAHATRCHVPIIIISHEQIPETIVACLDAGADDYLIKPFFFEELFSRVQAVLRRPGIIENNIFCIDDLHLDCTTQKLTRAGKIIYLTKKEYGIVEYLMRHKGCVKSRTDIVEHVWDIHANPFSNMIEMHMVNLRKKINGPNQKPLLHCVVGRGYKLDSER